jgi:hypothetical protein
MRKHPRPLPYFLCLLALAIACLSLALRSRAQTKNAPAPPAHNAQASQASQPSPSAPAPRTQSSSSAPNPYLMDGEAGPCSVEFNVTDAAGKPVASALIGVHLAYGFGGFHKLDMSVYTDPQGHAKFIGIPARVKNAPLQFRATKDQLVGVGTMNPATECQARHDIVMEAAKAK